MEDDFHGTQQKWKMSLIPGNEQNYLSNINRVQKNFENSENVEHSLH
jgi:hypothetical protein